MVVMTTVAVVAAIFYSPFFLGLWKFLVIAAVVQVVTHTTNVTSSLLTSRAGFLFEVPSGGTIGEERDEGRDERGWEKTG